MKIQKVTSTDLDAVTVLVKEVSEVDVLPLFSLQGQEEYKARVLPDLVTTLDDDSRGQSR